MADVSFLLGGDLTLSPTGDIALADGTTLGEQRVLRRLLTIPKHYIWHVEYGAGIPRFVGQTVNVDRIKAVVKSQMFRERVVARSPAPVINVTSTTNGIVTLDIKYVDSTTLSPVALTFNLNGQ